MRVVEDSVRRITIDMVPNLDPIRVVLEDIGPRQGRISIECYGKAWSAYWGGMGERTIAEFFSACSVCYLAGKLTDISSTVFDADRLSEFLKKELIEQRRKLELDSESARDFFEEIETIESTHSIDSLWHTHFDLLVKLLGDDWYCSGSLPTKPNPEYEYLCLIIRTVQRALEAALIK